MRKVTLGQKVRDIVTGFEGVAVARVEYLTGCDHIGVAPPMREGKAGETSYFDETRIEVLDPVPVLKREEVAATPGGPNRDAPRGAH